MQLEPGAQCPASTASSRMGAGKLDSLEHRPPPQCQGPPPQPPTPGLGLLKIGVEASHGDFAPRLGRGEICGNNGLWGQEREGCQGRGWGAELPRPGKPVQSEVRAWTSLGSAGRSLHLGQPEGLLKQVPVPPSPA